MINIDDIASLAMAEAAVMDIKRIIAHEESFNPISLDEHLKIAQQAGIPFVKTEQVGIFDVDTLLQFDMDGGNSEEVKRFYTLQNENPVKDHEMYRLDCCAGSMLKGIMDNYGTLDGSDVHVRSVDIEDPRVFEIMFVYPRDKIALHKREVIKPHMVNGYPLEFRVYIEESKVKGLSTYYIQTDVPMTHQYVSLAKLAVAYSETMINKMKELDIVQFLGKDSYTDEFYLTWDFIVSENMDLLFLEGGPSYGKGAHPCHFLNKNTNKVDEIKGFRFSQNCNF